jgi:hypothetical protein
MYELLQNDCTYLIFVLNAAGYCRTAKLVYASIFVFIVKSMMSSSANDSVQISHSNTSAQTMTIRDPSASLIYSRPGVPQARKSGEFGHQFQLIEVTMN